MAFGIVHRFPGGTKEQYEAALRGSIRLMGAFGGADQPHCRVHRRRLDRGRASTPRRAGNAFRDQTLMPGLQELGDAGFPGPPEQTTFEVYKVKEG